MFMRCKFCGEKVTKISEGTYKCPNHDAPIHNKYVIDGYTLISRINQLTLMHKLMQEANDEGIYLVWIGDGIPDCPSDDDFLYIATHDETYNECFDLFVQLIAKKGNRY